MKILDRSAETLGAEELAQLQLERLQALLVRLKRNVRRYRERLGALRIESLDQLASLPVTQPEELAGSFPYGLFALPLREVIRLHALLGPEGKPLVTGYTANDLTHWGRLVARQLVATGVTANDVIQICLGSGLSREASGYVLGAQMIEASVIAEDPYHIDYQLAMLQNYRPTVLITTPTHAAAIAQSLDQRRIDPQSLHLRTVLLSRPVPPAEREALAAGLFATVQCNFGVPELLNPGFCVECPAGRFHIHEDQFLVELQGGELHVTTLCREATPLLRYATRIAGELSREPCPCGRTFATFIPGRRLDGRVRVKETELYEAQVREVLGRTRAAPHPCQVDITPQDVVIAIRVTDALFDDVMSTLEKVRREVQSEFLTRLGIEVTVRFVTAAATGSSG